MAEQRDIAVELGVAPEPLAEIECARVYRQNMPAAPPQIVDGILHQGCKMLLAGTSKSSKSWRLLGLAMCVARWSGMRLAGSSGAIPQLLRFEVWAIVPPVTSRPWRKGH